AGVGSPAAAKTGSETFNGNCQFTGRVSFQPPLTNDPQPVSQAVDAPGTCSATFVDRRGRTHELSNAPVRFSESSESESASCAAGQATGSGALAFQYGKIDFGFSETRTGGAVVGTATGAESGSASGTGGVSPSEDPVVIAQRCAGSGLKS